VKESHFHLHDDLVQKCLRGDRAAYEQLYRLYCKAMYNICYRITNNEDDAEDVLQDAFVSAFTNLNSYNRDATFGAWLKRIVVNKAINHIKKKSLEFEPLDKADRVFEDEIEIEDKSYKVAEIRKAINMLPDGYRAVFSLYLLEGYDHSEISNILGISESTSKSQYNRSKKKLRELLIEIS